MTFIAFITAQTPASNKQKQQRQQQQQQVQQSTMHVKVQQQQQQQMGQNDWQKAAKFSCKKPKRNKRTNKLKAAKVMT